MKRMDITDPQEIQLPRDYNSYPANLRPALLRFMQDISEGVADEDATYRFAIAVGHTEAQARAMADKTREMTKEC